MKKADPASIDVEIRCLSEIRCQFIILARNPVPEIRCQFIILARKDEPTPDYAQFCSKYFLGNPVSVHHSCPKRRTDAGLRGRRITRTPDYADAGLRGRRITRTPDYADTGLRGRRITRTPD